MKWLNSLDELLYEVMSWLLFLPLTLARATFRPAHLMDEVERQASLPDEEQYGDILSPPLFLTLVLLLAHAVSTALGQTDLIIENQRGLASLVDDNATALLLRVVVFAGFPLFLEARVVRLSGNRLNRLTLRRPFYEQCYPAGVFALGVSIGTSLFNVGGTMMREAGAVLIGTSLINFVVVETLCFARLADVNHLRGLANVMLGLLQGTLFLLALGILFAPR